MKTFFTISTLSTHYAQVVPGVIKLHDEYMKQRLMKSLTVSLEWRLYAFIITHLFFWATTGHLWQATVLALQLQLILLIAHFGWYYFRESDSHR